MRIGRIAMIFIFMLGVMSTASSLRAQDSTAYLTFDCIDGAPGDTICIPVTVTNFDSIQSIWLGFEFDATVLRFIDTLNPALPGNIFSPGPTLITYLWTDPYALTVDLVDGETLLELCFEIIGIPGDVSSVGLAPSFNQEIGKVVDDATTVVPIVQTTCEVTVTTPVDVQGVLTSCGPINGIGDGLFTITVFGGTAPYSYDWVNTADNTINGSSGLFASGDSETQSVPPGNYEVTIMDNLGNTIILFVDVPVIGMEYAITPADPTCYNFTNGRISVEVANGAPPYNVTWVHTTDPRFSGITVPEPG